MKNEQIRTGKYEQHIWEQGFLKRNFELGKIFVKRNMLRIYKTYYNIRSLNDPFIMGNPYEIVYVPVKKINTSVDRSKTNSVYTRHGIMRQQGIIAGGDWDLGTKDFHKFNAFTAFRQRFIEGKEWEDTVYKKEFHERLSKKGFGRAGCRNWDEFKDMHLKRWEIMSRDIKKNGFKKQGDFGGKPEYEVEICVSRTGEILHLSGKHRIAMAKVLEIKEIPVLVSIWHKNYVELLKDSFKMEKLTTQKAITPISQGKLT